MDNLFQIVNDEYGVFIRLNLKDKEILDLEHNMLTKNRIRGLAKISYEVFDDNYSYNYDVTSKISLATFLEKEITTIDIITIFKNILEVIKNVKRYLIGINQILFDCKYIYIDVSSLDIYMICIPIRIDRTDSSVDLRAFFKDVMDVTQIRKDEEVKYVIDILNILNSSKKFSFLEFDKTIEDIYGEITLSDPTIEKDIRKLSVESIRYDNINSDVIKEDIKVRSEADKNEENIKHLESEKIDDIDLGQIELPNMSQEETESVLADEENTKSKKKNLGFLPFNIKDFLKMNSKGEEEKTESESSMFDDIKKVYAENFCLAETKKEPSVSNMITKTNDNEVGETILVKDISAGNPYLVRIATGEIMNIDSLPCRIGKDEKFADILVNNNETVSRAHAQIVCELGEYYLIDNNSKNHSYINEKIISSEEKSKISHNDMISFSNEKFIFKEF